MPAKKSTKNAAKKVAKKAPAKKSVAKAAKKTVAKKAPASKAAVKKTTTSVPAPAASPPSHQDLELAAYYNYLERSRNGSPGNTWSDWVEAVDQLGA